MPPIVSRILDTLRNPNGSLADGEIVITPSRAFTAADETYVAKNPVKYTVSSGVIDLYLIPSVGAMEFGDIAAFYTAEYSLLNRGQYSERWDVPIVGGPFTISQIRGTA